MSHPRSTKTVNAKSLKPGSGRATVSRPQTAILKPQTAILDLQRWTGNQSVHRALAAADGNSPAEGYNQKTREQERNRQARLVEQASADPARPLDDAVRAPMEKAFAANLAHVRVHAGAASDAAADSIGARAYTLGTDIYLGREGRLAGSAERSRLLAHEAVHTVQQGGRPVALRGEFQVSSPQDSAEREAGALADLALSAQDRILHSRALALRDTLRVASSAPLRASRVSPLIQRDLKGDYAVTQGKFKLDLKTESHPGSQSGLKGTIKFFAGLSTPDSNNIRLLQVVRTENLTTGKEERWSGGEANRHRVMTTADPSRGIEGGFFVDHSAAAASQRTKSADPAVSPYYRDYWPNASESQDGSKKGSSVSEASLWDFPRSSNKVRFSFETLAKDATGGHVYGTVMWGFTISDPAKGVVSGEHAVGRDVTRATTDEAIKQFNEFYRNPGASTAPK